MLIAVSIKKCRNFNLNFKNKKLNDVFSTLIWKGG